MNMIDSEMIRQVGQVIRLENNEVRLLAGFQGAYGIRSPDGMSRIDGHGRQYFLRVMPKFRQPKVMTSWSASVGELPGL